MSQTIIDCGFSATNFDERGLPNGYTAFVEYGEINTDKVGRSCMFNNFKRTRDEFKSTANGEVMHWLQKQFDKQCNGSG